MRIFLWVLKWLAIAVLSVVVLLAGLPWVPVVQDRIGTGQYTEYLEEHTRRLDLSVAGGNVSFADEFYGPGLIMLSEMHGYAMPQQLDVAIVQHLIDEGAALTYLAEMDPAQAMAVNTYFVTGDDAEIRSMFDHWADETAQWANNEFFAKLGQIKALNDTLAADKKVWFVGIDAIQDESLAKTRASTARPSALAGYGDAEAVNALNADLLDAALKRDGGRYSHMLANIALLEQYDQTRTRTFYGLWGLFHGSKVPVNGSDPLAMRLNEGEGFLTGRVRTISTSCAADCFNMMPSVALPSPMQGPGGEPYVWIPMSLDQPYIWRLRGVNLVKNVIGDAEASLVALGAEGSPYGVGPQLVDASGYLQMATPFEFDGGMADVADYLIVMQGSPGLTPWRGEVYDISGGGNAP